MPVVGSNLSQWGNAGEFETDRSTWGFADTANIIFQRSSLYGFAFSYSGEAILSTVPVVYTSLNWMFQRANCVAGKKYKAFAWVTKTGGSSGNSEVEILSNSGNLSKVSSIKKTFTQLNDTTTQIETIFQCTVSGAYTINIRSTNVDAAQTLAVGTRLYVDSFAVFEWQDPAPAVCTLAFNIPSCVVTNETGPTSNDGSITLAITGAAGTVEYSKDNGASWQSSNVFAGLDSGVYQCRVRELGNLSCVASQSFAVNIAAPTFSFTVTKTDETIAGAVNGTINVTVSGTVAPFTFSKNGGTTYQGSNVFTSLAPGTYTITVRDFNGQVLSQNVTIAPALEQYEKAYFSRDPIPFVVPSGANAAEDNYALYCDVRVEDVAGSGLFTSKLKTKLEPESNGLATFNLRQAFTDVFAPQPPARNTSVVQRITDRLKFYKNYKGELYDALTVPGTLTASNLFLVLHGGTDKKFFPTLNFFTDYLPTSKKFLSWNPSEKMVTVVQEEYLSFFVYQPGISVIKVRVTCTYTDGTTSAYTPFTQSGVVHGHLYQIPVGATHAGIVAHQPAKTLSRYTVTLLNQADASISETKTYVVAPVTHPRSRYFLYLNSVAGWDTLHTTGQASIEAVVEKTIVQKHLPMDYNALDGELEVNNSTYQRSGSYSSGYLKGVYGKEYQQALLDFMNSRRVYDITSGTRVPVIVEKASLRLAQDDSEEYFIRFSTQEAYVNHSYTPDV
jgi:hypothetical protein